MKGQVISVASSHESVHVLLSWTVPVLCRFDEDVEVQGITLMVVNALFQGAALSDNEVEVKTYDDPHKLLDINLDEYVGVENITLVIPCWPYIHWHGVEHSVSSVCLSVHLSVHTIKGKRLELSTPNSVFIFDALTYYLVSFTNNSRLTAVLCRPAVCIFKPNTRCSHMLLHTGGYNYQLLRMNPHDLLPPMHRAVHRDGHSVGYTGHCCRSNIDRRKYCQPSLMHSGRHFITLSSHLCRTKLKHCDDRHAIVKFSKSRVWNRVLEGRSLLILKTPEFP